MKHLYNIEKKYDATSDTSQILARTARFSPYESWKQCKNNKINLSILQERLKLLYTHTALF